MEPENKSQSLVSKIIGIVIALIAVIGVVTYLSQNKKEGIVNSEQEVTVQPKEEQTSSQTTKTSAGEAPVPSSMYKDGTYKATGTYTSPAGSETVDISLTLTNDVIVAATFKGNAENPGSIKWQGEFASGYTSQVVGKKIDELSLKVVNGSSLTPKGFLDAVAKIKTEAKS